jgi:hypothetical protein
MIGDSLLLSYDKVESFLYFCFGQWTKSIHYHHQFTLVVGREERGMGNVPETSTTRLNGRNDLVDIVADDTKPHILRKLLND